MPQPLGLRSEGKASARWLGIPACGLLCVPFLALLQQTPWGTFHLAYGDGDAIAVSIGLSSVSLLLVALLGTPLALWLARTRSAARHGVELLVLAAMLAPPLAMGILLITAYGPYGTIGGLLDRLGVTLNNNAGAFIIAQLYGGLAYYVLAAMSAFENVPLADEEAAWMLGASRWAIFTRVTLPQAARGLAAGLAIAWVRVIGEFGIVLVFAYFPQGIPVKLFVNLQNDGVDATYTLLWVLLLAALPLPFLCLTLFRPHRLAATDMG